MNIKRFFFHFITFCCWRRDISFSNWKFILGAYKLLTVQVGGLNIWAGFFLPPSFMAPFPFQRRTWVTGWSSRYSLGSECRLSLSEFQRQRVVGASVRLFTAHLLINSICNGHCANNGARGISALLILLIPPHCVHWEFKNSGPVDKFDSKILNKSQVAACVTNFKDYSLK